MPQNQLLDITELIDREISSKRSLFSFLTHDPNTHICFQNHSNIISSISYTSNSFARVLDHTFSNVCFLGWRATADTDDWGFTGDFEKEGFKFGVFHAVADCLAVDHETGV